MEGFEPPWIAPLVSETSASAGFRHIRVGAPPPDRRGRSWISDRHAARGRSGAGFGDRAAFRASRRTRSSITFAECLSGYAGAERTTYRACICIACSSLTGWGRAAPSESEGAAREVRDQLRRRRVEADDVELSRVVLVRDREAVRQTAGPQQGVEEANPPGFEPGPTRLELVMLPLHHGFAKRTAGSNGPLRGGAPGLFRLSYIRVRVTGNRDDRGCRSYLPPFLQPEGIR